MSPENLKNLIPKDKFDFETTNQLSKFTLEEIRPIIPNLLEWLQDLNWPVSKPVSDYLLQYTDEITDEILKILKTDDEVWKYWIIKIFGENTSEEKLKEEIIRLSKFPTESEKDAEVDQISKDIIEFRNWEV